MRDNGHGERTFGWEQPPGSALEILMCNSRAFLLNLNYDVPMDDWKDQIRLTIQDKRDAKSADETRRETEAIAADLRVAEQARFLKEVVRPALEEIKGEL